MEQKIKFQNSTFIGLFILFFPLIQSCSGTLLTSGSFGCPSSIPDAYPLTLTYSGSNQVTLNWENVATQFRIAYKAGGIPSPLCNDGTTLDVTGTSTTLSNLSDGQQYTFRVCTLESSSLKTSCGPTATTAYRYFIYAADGTAIKPFSIADNSKKLSALSSTTFGASITSLTTNTAQTLLFASRSTTIQPYAVQSDGTLSAKTSIAAGGTTVHLTTHPTKNVLYALIESAGDRLIESYSFDANGTLTLLGSHDDSGGNATTSAQLVVHPNGNYVYMLRPTAATSYAAFTVQSDGSLNTGVAPVNMTSPDPMALVTDASGGYAYYVASSNNNVYATTFSSDGSSLTDSAASVSGTGLATPTRIQLDTTLGVLVVANSSATNLHSFTVSGTTLTEASLVPMSDLAAINQFIFHPQGSYLYALTDTNGIFQEFRISSAGQFSALSGSLNTMGTSASLLTKLKLPPL